MTVPHYGKREAGALTAASPGDTLYFNFGSYNDSGDSEAMTGFAVTDIELFKNGVAVPRATDSGYSLISDTGQVGDRVGLHRFSVQLYNTTDDTGFFDVGGWYQVAVDAVTVDAKTVRFWAGSFEIGRDRVDVRAIDGDTGPADNLGRIAGDTGTGSYIYRESDTGGFADAVWGKDSRTLTAFQFDTGVWGSNFASGRTLTSFLFDTGVAATVWRSSTSTYTTDTGSVAYAQGRVMAVRNDTGAAHLDQGRFGVLSDSGVGAAILDTGKVAAAVWVSQATRTATSVSGAVGSVTTVSANAIDTGSFTGTAAFANDTGALEASISAGVWSAATRTLTAFALDTGIADTVWKYSTSGATADTGSVGYAQGRLMAVRNDTGAAHLDAGRLGVTATATLDTGAINNAIWNGLRADHVTAGTFGLTLMDSGMAAAVLDTGKVAAAVWTSHATRALTAFAFDTGIWGSNAVRTLTSFGFDTGVADTVWKASQSSFADTGSFAYAQGRLMKVNNDTGAAHLDQGRLGVVSDSGKQAAVLDTGKVSNAVWDTLRAGHVGAGSFGRDLTDSGMIAAVLDTGKAASAVWTSHATRALTAFQFDTGIWGSNVARTLTAFALDTGVADTVWKYSTSGATADTGSVGYAQGRLMAVRGDTGAAHLDAGRLGVTATATVDTGVINNAVWNGNVSDHVADTGSFGYAQGRLLAVKNDTGAAHLDAGRLGVSASAVVDTGVVVNAVWRATVSDHVSDTGATAYTLGRLMAVRTDTGAAHLDAGRLGVTAAATVDTGVVNNAVWNGNVSDHVSDTGSFGYAQGRLMAVRGDTGAAHLDQGRLGVISDSGRQAAVLDTGKVAAAVWASHATRALTSFAFDTGITQTVWRDSPSSYTSDTGSAGYAQGRIMAVRGDTGAAHLDQGRFGVLSDSGRMAAVLDTGKVASAVWTSHATRGLTNATNIDTGIAQHVWRQSTSTFTADTGSVAYAQGRLMAVRNDTGAAHLDQGRLGVLADSGVLAAVLDTGKVASAVWSSHATRALTAFAFDTGVAHTVWSSSQSSFADTGSFAYAQGRVQKVLGDTGAAHLDQGRFGVISDSGRQAAVLDTGKVAAAVWASHATRVLTANTNLAGLAVNVEQIDGDTGPADNLGRIAGDTGAESYLADTVWDEVLTASTHNVVSSAGRRLRTLQTGGNYEGGMVWVDTVAGVAGTIVDENGVVTNPVLTLADARTLATAIPLKSLHIANGSTITLASATTNFVVEGHEWILALGAQDISGSAFIGSSSVTGTSTGTTDVEFENCIFGNGIVGCTLPPGTYIRCGFNTGSGFPFVGSAAGRYVFVDCYSNIAVGGASTPYFTFTGASAVMFRRYSGGADITFDAATGALTYECLGGGNLTVALAGSDLQARGTIRDMTLTGITAASLVEFVGTIGNLSLAGANGTVTLDGIVGAIVDSRAPAGTLNLPVNTMGMVGNVTGNLSGSVGSMTTFNHDTGIAQTVWRESGSSYSDTGSLGYMVDNPGEHVITLDTGSINQAVWTTDGARTLTSGAAIWEYGDTGARIVNVRQIMNDTGAASGLTTVASDIPAIKAKTDLLTFDTGGEVHADIRKVNNVPVSGTGTSGDEWGP